jgi:3-keto-5-aminohexanoate cleavage enzyme
MREQNPALPYTPEEFAEEAYRAYDSGAAVVHIHVRNPRTGAPTHDVEIIRTTIDAIRTRCPHLIINMSSAILTSGDRKLRITPLIAVKPAMGSINTNSMNFALVNWKTGRVISEMLFENSFSMIVEFNKTMRENGIKPEFEIYDMGGLFNVLLLKKQGIFEEPMHFQMVFGVAGGVPYEPGLFAGVLSHLPPGATYSACGAGPNQFRAAMTSAVNGGHIRVGLEDNVRMPNGELAGGSWEQVEWAAEVARSAGREIASPQDARRILGLSADGARPK